MEEYLSYERAEVDFLFRAAQYREGPGIDVTDITGRAKLSKFIVTRAGRRTQHSGNNAYEYKHLALNFQNKIIEPFMVTLDPLYKIGSLKLNSHAGQEFDYVIEGELKIILDNKEITLREGDSLFYDSSIPHAMYALNNVPAKFLAIVTK